MNVANKAADRHRRKSAIGHQVVPIAVTQLGDVEAKRRQEILRVLGRQPARVQSPPQPHRDLIGVVGADDASTESIEQSELLLRAQHGMIGDVVGGAYEIVEREDRLAMARMNEKGCYREILIPVP